MAPVRATPWWWRAAAWRWPPDAVVVAADATRVLVAVPADAAPAVAEAAASGDVVLLLRP